MSIHNHRNNVGSGFKDIQNFEYFKSIEISFDNNEIINSYTIEEFLNMEHYHHDYDIRIESGIIDSEYIGSSYSELEYGRLKIVNDEVIEDILDQIFEINDDFEDIFE